MGLFSNLLVFSNFLYSAVASLDVYYSDSSSSAYCSVPNKVAAARKLEFESGDFTCFLATDFLGFITKGFFAGFTGS